MQKIVALLEQHVEKLAIGLGALFVLFMTYSYVLKPVAEVQIGSETLSAGAVDPYTVDHVVKGLESAINNNEKITMQVPQYVGAFKDAMGWVGAQPLVFAGNWNVQTQDVSPVTQVATPVNPKGPGDPPPGPIPPGGGGQKVAALPVPPKAIPNASRFGRSLVLPPQANGQPAPLPPPGQDAPGSVDKDWVTQLFKLNLGELATAFEKAQIPPPLRATAFLQVELVRQEKMADGSWGNEQTIAPISVWRNGQLPPSFPAEGQPREIQAQYLAWATANTSDIIQPLFFTTIPGKGDQWTKPGQQVAGTAIFDPNTWVGPKGTLTDDQWQMVLNARREKTRLQNEQKNQNRPKPAPRTPGSPRGGGAPPDGVSFAPAKPGSAPPPTAGPTQFQARPPAGRPPYPPSDGVSMDGPPDVVGGAYGGGAVAVPGLPVPGTDYPNGEFDPTLPTWRDKTIEIWAHDDTVVSGKTYQYKMRYKVKNPIFGAGNVAVNDKLSDQFAITSPDSDWTPSLTVPSQVNFFVASGRMANSNTVRVQVFRWDKGEQKKEEFNVSPGDLVGSLRGGVDFSTEWTVVDLRDETRGNTTDTHVFLINNTDGSMVMRSSRSDANDPLFTSLKEQISAKATEAAGTVAGSVPGGAVAPGGRTSRGGEGP